MKRVALAAAALLLSFVHPVPAFAQSTVVVSVQQGGSAASGVFVALVGTSGTTKRYAATTDATGTATFSNVDDGTYDARAQAPGTAVAVASLTPPGTTTASLTLPGSGTVLKGLGAYGSQTGMIVADGRSGVFYLNTESIPSLYRTANYGGRWVPATLSSDDRTYGLDASTTANLPTTSAKAGEIAVIVQGNPGAAGSPGSYLYYSRDFGVTWSKFAMSGVPATRNTKTFWAHASGSTVSVFFVVDTASTDVYWADMTQATPAFTKMTGSYKANAGDAVSVGNSGTAPVFMTVSSSTGHATLWIIDATPDSGDSSVSVNSVTPTTASDGASPLALSDLYWAYLGGPATGVTIGSGPGAVTAPNTILVFSDKSDDSKANARMTVCSGGTPDTCAPTTTTTFLSFSDVVDTNATFTNGIGGYSSCAANREAGAIGSITPIGGGVAGGGGTVGKCWVNRNGSELQVRTVDHINNNTAMAYDAGYDGVTNLVVLSGDGQHGATKSARNGTTGTEGLNRPYFPWFPTLASSGTASTSGGVAINGLNSAIVSRAVFAPDDANNLAVVMSFTGGGRTVGSTDSGATWFTLVDRGGSTLDWWNGATAGTQWILQGSAGMGNWAYAGRFTAFSTSTTISDLLNGSGFPLSATDFGEQSNLTNSPGIKGVIGIPATDWAVLGTYDGAVEKLHAARLTAGTPNPSVTLTEFASQPVTGSGMPSASVGQTRFAYCGTDATNNAESVRDKLFVAAAARTDGGSGALWIVRGFANAIASGSFDATKLTIINTGLPTGDLRDVKVDCATGTVWLAQVTSVNGVRPPNASGIMKSTDGGATFNTISLPVGAASTLLADVVALDFDKSKKQIVVAVSRSGDIGRTTDAGATWAMINDTTTAACQGVSGPCGRGFGSSAPGSFTMPPATGSGSMTIRAGVNVRPAVAGTITRTGVLGSGAGLFSVAIDGSTNGGAGMSLTPLTLKYAAVKSGAGTAIVSVTPAQTVSVTITGASAWTAAADQSWVKLTSGSGSGSGMFSVSIDDPSNTLGGTTSASATITVTSAALGLTSTIPLTLTVNLTASTSLPFGSFDTPADNATGVVGAIPVTGWALDDVGVSRVMLWRNCVEAIDRAAGACVSPASGVAANYVYIGDGAFLAGARPDVEALTAATTPEAYNAGWGYLMLTTALPHLTRGTAQGGQGQFTLTAYALDVEGNANVLGSKTITLDNDAATIPFGAIDTPTQGGTMTTSIYANFGWAMTQSGKCLDTSSTAAYKVYIDGVSRTLTPATNWFPALTRADIAAAYPGLCNSNNALAAYYIDSTALSLSNGLHTIGWDAIDDGGNVAGIGSRFFNVLVGATAPPLTEGGRPAVVGRASELAALPSAVRNVAVRVGSDTAALEAVAPAGSGDFAVRLPGGGRIALDLGGAVESGYLVVGDELRPLPAGSTLDGAAGRFAWQPPVPFFGPFHLVFTTGGERLDVVATIADPTAEGGVKMHIDLAGPSVVAGWAVDPLATSGSGIDTLHVWAYRRDQAAEPLFLGAAAVGGERPDVAAVFGDQFARAGFTLSVSGLEPGTYDLFVYPWAHRAGRFGEASSVRIVVP